jgi:hypothetical protein
MPLSAAGFIVSTAQLAKLGRLAASKDAGGFRDFLHKEARPMQPAFAHAGTVIEVLLEYLEEQGIHVVSADPGPDADEISEAGLGLEFCLARGEAAELVEVLGAVHPPEEELRAYYGESAGEPLARAGAAMLDGLEFLKRACGSLASDDERLLLFVR